MNCLFVSLISLPPSDMFSSASSTPSSWLVGVDSFCPQQTHEGLVQEGIVGHQESCVGQQELFGQQEVFGQQELFEQHFSLVL